jgi:hypothetical protein
LLLAALLGYSYFSSDYPVIAVRPHGPAPLPNITFPAFLEANPPSPARPCLFLLAAQFRKDELENLTTTGTVFVFPNATFNLTNCPVQDVLPVNVTSCTKVIGLDLDSIVDAFSNARYLNTTLVAVQDLGKVDFGLANPFTTNGWNAIFVSVFLILLIIWAMVKFLGIDAQTRFAKKHN